MAEAPNKHRESELDDEFASTTNDQQHPAVAEDRGNGRPVPQGGKGTPSQAEGDRDEVE